MQNKIMVRLPKLTRFLKTGNAIILSFVFIGGLLLAPAVQAQDSFPGENLGPIPDAPGAGPNNYGTPLDVTFNVTGVPGVVTDVSLSFKASHTFVGDLKVTLISPSGTEHILFERTGATDETGAGSANDLSSDNIYTFGDLATDNWWTVVDSANPIPTSFSRTVVSGGVGVSVPPPVTSINSAFVGEAPNGTWTLRFEVGNGGDTGEVTLANLFVFGAVPVQTVTTAADTNDGVCDSQCSLREAIATAQSGSAIAFSPLFGDFQTIALSGTELVIDKDLQIEGPGARLLTIKGNGASRIIRVTSGNTVGISGLTVTGGVADTGGTGSNGGGIFNSGDLTLTNVSVAGNTALDVGGGIFTEAAATLTVSSSTISGNTAQGAGGGGIYTNGPLTVTNATISGNSGLAGGAIDSYDGTVTVRNTTITNNSATSLGGGVYNNLATTVKNTIIAGNHAPTAPDFLFDANSEGYNLIGDGSQSTGFTAVGDQVGGNGNPVIDPRLAPLGNFFGQTDTHPPLADSPALDKGLADGVDQRGMDRKQDIGWLSPASGGDNSDIGSYEANPLIVSNTNASGAGSLREAIISTPVPIDGRDILFDPAVFSSPQTIDLGGLEITFPKTVFLNGPGAGLLTVSGNQQSRVFFVDRFHAVGIAGISISNGLVTGDGGGGILNQGKLMLIESNVTKNSADGGGGIFSEFNGSSLTVSNCLISENSSGESGGGIKADTSPLTVINSTISGNTAVSDGGGIDATASPLTVLNSTVSGNTTATIGGGIKIANGAIDPSVIASSTISDNSAVYSGGGIFNLSGQNLEIISSTISNNTADAGGGILNSSPAPATIKNTIVANNSSSTNPDISGTIDSQGFNLIEDPAGATITGDIATNITGVDPLLGSLKMNGGPTPTRALAPLSPAIDKGVSSGDWFDQRGLKRTFDNPDVPNLGPSVGDGTDIGAFERQLIDPAGAVPFDFDGDGKTDVSVFRPSPQNLLGNATPEGSSSQWWLLRSSDQAALGLTFGAPTDFVVPADFTGDGKADIAFWRPSTGQWFILRSEDLTYYAFPFGGSGDIPAPGDFDGDGKADPAVFRPSSGTWYILRSSDQQVASVPFGISADKPIVADYDGDGKDDIGVFRSTENQFWLLRSTDGLKAYQFSSPGDQTAVGDWTGDGRADVAFFRPSDSSWFVIRSEDDSYFSFPWGSAGDIPAPGDYDGDGKTDPAVWRPADSTWYILGSTNGFEAVNFGAAGDIPVPSSVSAQ